MAPPAERLRGVRNVGSPGGIDDGSASGSGLTCGSGTRRVTKCAYDSEKEMQTGMSLDGIENQSPGTASSSPSCPLSSGLGISPKEMVFDTRQPLTNQSLTTHPTIDGLTCLWGWLGQQYTKPLAFLMAARLGVKMG